MSKVFVLQEQIDRDLSTAVQYGKIDKVFSPGSVLRMDLSKVVQTIDDWIEEEFDSEKDYIIWSGGDPLLLLLFGSRLATYGIPEINWLQWQRKVDPLTGQRVNGNGYYLPRKINLTDKNFGNYTLNTSN